MAIVPSIPQTLYAGSGGGTHGGVFKSIDGGATWALTGLGAGWVYSIAVDPANPQNLYAGVNKEGHRGVYASTDAGATWARVTEGMGTQQVGALLVDPSGTKVQAATLNGVWELTLP